MAVSRKRRNSSSVRQQSQSAVAVERAVEILFLLAERGEVSVTDVARLLGYSPGAAHRILTALKRKGLLEQRSENDAYFVGWSMLRMMRAFTGRTDLRSVARPFMVELRDLTRQTVTLNVRVGSERVCVDVVEGLERLRWVPDVGEVAPLYAGASGRVFLAHMSPAEVDHYFATTELAKFTPFTVTNKRVLKRQLDEVRAQGYSVAFQDRTLGWAGIAAPIFEEFHQLAAALTIGGLEIDSGPTQLQEWTSALSQAGHAISQILGDTEATEEVTALARRNDDAASSRTRSTEKEKRR